MTIEQLKQLVEKIKTDAAGVTADELAAATDAIRAIVAEAKDQEPSEDNIALLTDLVAAKSAVDAETTTRAEAAAAQAAKTAELLDELGRESKPATSEPGDGEKGDADGEQAEDTPDDNEDPAPAAENDEDIVAEQVDTPELVTASAIADAVTKGIQAAFAAQSGEPEAPKGRVGRPGAGTAQVKPGRDAATMRVFAGKDNGAAEITDNAGLAEAFYDAYRGTYQTKGFAGRITVAHAETSYPESRTLGRNSVENFRKLDALTSRKALTAAGGLCAPLDVDYSVDTVGSTARPLRDALVRVTVDRGGIRYRSDYSAADAIEGTGIWTNANDEAADDADDSGAPTKAVGVVDCPDELTAEVYAVYNQLEFSNVTTRFDPESTDANIRLSQIAHARLAENTLYNTMATGSKLVTGSAQIVGAARHLLGELDKVIAYFRNRHRIDENVSLSWVAPLWVKNEIRTDIAYQLAAGDWEDALGVTDAQITSWFSERGVSPVWFLDGSTGSATVNGQTIPRQTYDNVAAGSAIPGYPAKVDSLLFETGKWVFLDGGTLDLGLVRDSGLNARNRYQTFMESWEGVADRGIESLRPLFSLKPTGATAGTKDTSS